MGMSFKLEALATIYKRIRDKDEMKDYFVATEMYIFSAADRFV